MNLSLLLSRSVDVLPWSLRNQVKHIPVLRVAQRWLLRRGLQDQQFVYRISAGPAKGLNFRVRMPDDKLYWTGTWEHDVTTAIASLVPPGSVCFDVGGHRAFMAGVMLRNGARTAYCFEPNPSNGEKINDLAALNPGLDLRLMPIAVGDADGTATFSIMPESSMGKLESSPFQPGAATVEHLTVKVRSLDSLIAAGEVEVPDFVKIDIEGAELSALQGAAQLIERRGPTFLIEVHSLELALKCRELLTAAGYRTRFVQDHVQLEDPAAYVVSHLIAERS
jgi:FkbM family methyltransferase